MKKKYISVLALACLFSASAMAQQKITGVVKDAQGEPVLGALVTTVGHPTEKSITDQKGVFTLNANQGEYIEIVYADSQKKRVWVKGESLEICLEDLFLRLHPADPQPGRGQFFVGERLLPQHAGIPPGRGSGKGR